MKNDSGRRAFIRTGILLTASHLLGCRVRDGLHSDIIMTVNGPIPPSQLGKTLTHEHVLVDFIGADQISPGRYDSDEVIRVMTPYLQKLKAGGIRSMMDATPSYLGKDPLLLQKLSLISGLNIITNTGYYGASREKFLPGFISNEDEKQLAARWIKEWKEGIDQTGIKPGFIKIGVDEVPFSESIQKIIKAAALTHLETGLTINIHTSQGGKTAMEELSILKSFGISPEAWVWVHAQNEKEPEYFFEIASAGGWVSFDGIAKNNFDENVERLSFLKKKNLLKRVLISQDAGWYHVGETDGGSIRDFNDLPDLFLPYLLQKGFSPAEIQILVEKNPAEAFRIRVRKIGLSP